jgi:hypothetical protein
MKIAHDRKRGRGRSRGAGILLPALPLVHQPDEPITRNGRNPCVNVLQERRNCALAFTGRLRDEPRARLSVIQKLDTGLLQNSGNLVNRIRARADWSIKSLHPLDGPQRHARFLRKLYLRPAQESPRRAYMFSR